MTLLLCAAPAQASPHPSGGGVRPLSASDGFVAGAGFVSDDWNDEATLGRCCYPNSNYAAMWQAILWADGFLSSAQVDCRFGPITESATYSWQWTYSVAQTGKFDLATRQRAGSYLAIDGPSPDGNGDYVHYIGTEGRRVDFHRNGSGAQYRYDMNLFGEWRGVWYTVINYARCQ